MKLKAYKNHLALGCIAVLIASCCQTDNKIENQNVNSISKEIPKDRNGNLSVRYLLKDSTELSYGFKTLENGFDSLAIRIWFGGTINPVDQIVELKRSQSQWKANLFTISHKFDSAFKLLSFEKNFFSKSPKSGWNNFIDSLYKLQILTLPNDQDIKNYHQVMDGSGIVVQIATKSTYRIYYYTSPYLFVDEFWQAKNMELIMDLIEHEFDFKRIQ